MANDEGTPLHGDRSAWNTTEHADEHARDINESALLRHLPAPASDGNFAVDDGTNWVVESGATARTSIGLGTGDSPTFTNLTLEGKVIIDVDDTEALLVRKDGDGGDVFIVDTTNSHIEITGKVGIGAVPLDDALAIVFAPENDTAAHGVICGLAPAASSNGTYNNAAAAYLVTPVVDSGITNLGFAMGCDASVYGLVDDFEGTLTNLYGMRAQAGLLGGTGTITNSYALYARVLQQTGTITNSYGLYIAAPLTGGTVTNEWAIYVADDAPSYYAGNIDSNGAMSSATLTLSAEGPTDDLDVSDVNTVFIDTVDNNVTLGGTTGGVDGQVLYIVVHDATNNTTVENEEGVNQSFVLHAGADETMTAEYGGWVFINEGGNHWHDASHAKHV